MIILQWLVIWAMMMQSIERQKLVEVYALEETPEFSENILVATDFGGSSWGEFYECISAVLVIHTDRTVDVIMPTRVGDYYVLQSQVITTLELTEEQYQNIEKAIDRTRLYWLDPDENVDVCDGDSLYLALYGKDDQVLKNCGGYMPRNKYLVETYRTLHENLPVEELARIRSEHIEKLRADDLEMINAE